MVSLTPRPDVLVVGDANVDLVLRGDVRPRFGQEEQLLEASSLVLGSSAGITACGLARLGVNTALVAVVGDDVLGRFTTAALSTAGVDVHQVRTTSEATTGLSVILSEPEDRAILTDTGAITRVTADDVRRAVAAHRPQLVHFASYFLLPGLAGEMPGLLGELRAQGIRTSLDTNWDPANEWAGIGDIVPLVDFLLPNSDELRAIAAATLPADDSGDAGALACASRLARLGPQVVVKAGAEGGWSVSPQGVSAASAAQRVDVVDTTGAGDSFNAGYLAAVVYGVEPEELRLRWATAAGAHSVQGAGGTSAQARREEIEAALA